MMDTGRKKAKNNQDKDKKKSGANSKANERIFVL